MTIRVGFVGVGNCAAALMEGIDWYTQHPDVTRGLMSATIGGYRVSDIEPVVGFDVDKLKVGGTLAAAADECQRRFEKPLPFDGPVLPAAVLDGLSRTSDVQPLTTQVTDPVRALADHAVDVLVNYLPVGSTEASTQWARTAAHAGIGFVNCIPVPIARNPEIAGLFTDRAPLIGDDIKSQYGATILHRALARICADRGVHLDTTYQLNVGGNADFRNMLDQSRLGDKRDSKTSSVTDVYPLEPDRVHIGPSDFVAHLGDRKIAFINLTMEGFAGAPMQLEARLDVVDSPNSAGIVVDAVRHVATARDAGVTGVLDDASSYLMKAPRNHDPEDGASHAE